MTAQIKVPIEVKMNMDEIIERLKKDDFVQVVRCKDCKHHANVRDGFCILFARFGAKENDYCSRAEREEE